MTSETVLVICTGNICRSPVAEALLSHRLSNTGIKVRSVGTHAMRGHPPSPEALEFVADTLGEYSHHLGEQLDKSAADQAALLLTMTEEQRTWVLRIAPRAIRRTFTMREFARIVAALEEGQDFSTLADLVTACALQRRHHLSPKIQNDIADPTGLSPGAYAHAFAQVEHASQQIAPALTSHLSGLSG